MASRQRGFTVVELMIAITIMGVTMLLVTMGVIQVSRYYKQAQSKTALLNANRELHSQFAQDLQYSGYDPTLPLPTITYMAKNYNLLCVGTKRYIIRTTSFTDNAFAVDTITGQGECTSKPLSAAILANSPMPPDTRVTQFALASSGGIYTLSTRFVVANSDNLFPANNYNNDCIAAALGGQYCAVGALKSTLVRKVSN